MFTFESKIVSWNRWIGDTHLPSAVGQRKNTAERREPITPFACSPSMFVLLNDSIPSYFHFVLIALTAIQLKRFYSPVLFFVHVTYGTSVLGVLIGFSAFIVRLAATKKCKTEAENFI